MCVPVYIGTHIYEEYLITLKKFITTVLFTCIHFHSFVMNGNCFCLHKDFFFLLTWKDSFQPLIMTVVKIAVFISLVEEC